MTDATEIQTVVLTIELSKELYEKLQRVAAAYTENASDFPPKELAVDYVRRMIVDEVDDPVVFDNDDHDPRESFRRAWGQAMRGEGRPADEVLKELRQKREAEDE